MAENRVVSYAPPLKDNPLFRDAMARCNEAQKTKGYMKKHMTPDIMKHITKPSKEKK